MNPVPIALIVDDSGPVNTYHFHDSTHFHELLIPPVFAKKFVSVCKRHNICGKFSIVPVPCGLGRLDRKVSQVPAKNIRDYVKIIKQEIEPRFSITPEILTHFLAYVPETDRCMHVCEDVYFSTLDANAIAKYVGFALEIVQNLGITPTGITSPWSTGIDNENNYAKGIGMAFRKVMKADHCFYFLHCRDNVKKPTVMCNTPETGRVVTIPDNTFDPYWGSQFPVTKVQAVKNVRTKINELLSNDGKTGLIRELFEQQLPITLIGHWQSLWSDGREIGLEGLDTLAGRINKVFGKQIEWMSFAEMAERWKD